METTCSMTDKDWKNCHMKKDRSKKESQNDNLGKNVIPLNMNAKVNTNLDLLQIKESAKEMNVKFQYH